MRKRLNELVGQSVRANISSRISCMIFGELKMQKYRGTTTYFIENTSHSHVFFLAKDVTDIEEYPGCYPTISLDFI